MSSFTDPLTVKQIIKDGKVLWELQRDFVYFVGEENVEVQRP